ncbi:hypothetical protein [Paenibacillus nasutitermitis]|uniref:Helicase XPB/Ssl2 N-terminal domain-containing protein n=1 Tax=Paenibacillus nasutitermitis TaxID=1652958 RepID=A0A917DTC4_9BACL|nr:hypothetical protein [Paenibacillus nasutitermitis]GGD69081.1 hypothetical protein GCM10010911_28610 [Paenibacillus nasutitermitis]
MNLADMLSYADIGQLSRIATTYQCECSGNSKNELIQSILSTVNRREVFETQIGSMKMEDLRFINSLLFDPRDSFSLEELIARVQQSKFNKTDSAQQKADTPERPAATDGKKPAKKSKKTPESVTESGPRETISRFKQYGWLFNGYAGPNRYLFQVPSDVKERFKETLGKKFLSQAVYAEEEPHAYRDEQLIMGEDVKHFLDFVYHNEIPLTSDSAMYKRSLIQIMDRFGVKEDFPARGEWRFGYGRRMKDYPNRMSLIYDYCYFYGWLSEADSLLTLTPSGKERQAMRMAEPSDKLYRFWLRLYKGAIPNIRALTYWIDQLSHKWVMSTSLQSVLTPYIKPFYYDQPETILEQRLIGMMMHMGLLRIGEVPSKGQVIRMTPMGRSIVAGLSIEDDAIVLN